MEVRSAASPRRRRGERAGLDLATVIAAARSLAPAAPTMQAVADALGVDRKALSHYVAGRDELIELVAMEALAERLGAAGFGDADDWQDACRAFAQGLAAGLVEIGLRARHFRWDVPRLGLLAPAEAVLARLVAAGFGDETAARALSMLMTLAAGYAQNKVAGMRETGQPLAARLRQTFDAAGGAGLHNLRRITDSPIRAQDARQLDMMIDIFVAGLDLASRVPPAAPA